MFDFSLEFGDEVEVKEYISFVFSFHVFILVTRSIIFVSSQMYVRTSMLDVIICDSYTTKLCVPQLLFRC